MNTFLKRTDSDDPHFRNLVAELDKELWERYPEIQQNYAPFNKVDGSARVIVAYKEDDFVGCGCFRPGADSDSVEVKRMFVTPSGRNQGIGKLILIELEKWARETGFKKVRLETGIRQPEAIAAYTKSGYERIPNFPPYENAKESICMMKNL